MSMDNDKGVIMSLKISSKGWVVIPAELRKKYRLEPGDEVNIVDDGGVLSIVPVLGDAVKEAAGMLRDGESLSEALLKERQAERKREK